MLKERSTTSRSTLWKLEGPQQAHYELVKVSFVFSRFQFPNQTSSAGVISSSIGDQRVICLQNVANCLDWAAEREPLSKLQGDATKHTVKPSLVNGSRKTTNRITYRHFTLQHFDFQKLNNQRIGCVIPASFFLLSSSLKNTGIILKIKLADFDKIIWLLVTA